MSSSVLLTPSSPSGGGGSTATAADRVEYITREEETHRVALMGDAVSVAASAVYFAVRLVDATLDLHVGSPLLRQGQTPEVTTACHKLVTFLEFRESSELRSMAWSMVLPLIAMRLLGSFKDIWYSFFIAAPADSGTGRRVLDAVDFFMMNLGLYLYLVKLPPLEGRVRDAVRDFLSVQGNTGNSIVAGSFDTPPWVRVQVQESFDDMEFCHLLALAQAGLLLLVSLLKLSARSLRASNRAIARALEEEEIDVETERQLKDLNDELTKLRSLSKTPLKVMFEDQVEGVGAAITSSSPSSQVATPHNSAVAMTPVAVPPSLISALKSPSSPRPTLKQDGYEVLDLPPVPIPGDEHQHNHFNVNVVDDILIPVVASFVTFTVVYRNYHELLALFRGR